MRSFAELICVPKACRICVASVHESFFSERAAIFAWDVLGFSTSDDAFCFAWVFLVRQKGQ